MQILAQKTQQVKRIKQSSTFLHESDTCSLFSQTRVLFHSSSSSTVLTRLSGPVPLLRKSSRARNRSRHLCICSQNSWPLDHLLTASLNKQQSNKENFMACNKSRVVFCNSLTSGTAGTFVASATLYFHITWFDAWQFEGLAEII
jgi:hypothetical protein